MGFASAYLNKRTLFPQQICEAPVESIGIIVVVPAYDEPDIEKLLDSLSQCKPPDCGVEVIVELNSPSDASVQCILNNRKYFEDIKSWKKSHTKCFFRLFSFLVENPSVRDWGAGLARKTGMDEAIRRFDFIGRPQGVILCLDADCTVSENYFCCISEHLYHRNDRSACSIYFEHPIKGIEYPELTYKHIALYELHLRYYYQSLLYSGFSDATHTVGSAMAVKAIAYVKAGGMNRRQAGEDFYFIQKLIPLGGYFNLNSTTVIPSPRVSDRVPFGTGASMKRLSIDNSPTYLTYNIGAFIDLHVFFGLTGLFFKSNYNDLIQHYDLIPESIRAYLSRQEMIGKISEIKDNTSSEESFTKRFFGWFNMFRIVKYLNASHTGYFMKEPVETASLQLLDLISVKYESADVFDILGCYRSLEHRTL